MLKNKWFYWSIACLGPFLGFLVARFFHHPTAGFAFMLSWFGFFAFIATSLDPDFQTSVNSSQEKS